MRKYRIFSMSVVRAISAAVVPAAIRVKAENSPAEVLLSADISDASNGESPIAAADEAKGERHRQITHGYGQSVL